MAGGRPPDDGSESSVAVPVRPGDGLSGRSGRFISVGRLLGFGRPADGRAGGDHGDVGGLRRHSPARAGQLVESLDRRLVRRRIDERRGALAQDPADRGQRGLAVAVGWLVTAT